MAELDSSYFYKTVKFEVLTAVLLNKENCFILKTRALKYFETSVAIYWLWGVWFNILFCTLNTILHLLKCFYHGWDEREKKLFKLKSV